MLQILTLKLDGITAGDYLAWCRDPDPPALGLGLRSIAIHADPLGDTITATLDWNQPAPPAAYAASAAGLPLPPGADTLTRTSNDGPYIEKSPASQMSRNGRRHSHPHPHRRPREGK
jgi:hypothetical protein